MIKNVKIMIIQAFKSKFYQYFVFTKKNTPQICLILSHLAFYVLLISGKKLVTIKQSFKVRRVVRNRTFIYKGLTVT